MSPLLSRLRSLSTFPRPLRPALITLTSILTWIPVLSFIHTHVAQLMWVTGPSMYPFLNTDYNTSTRKDVVWVDMWAPANGLRRGMVVAFWSPNSPEKMVIKRVVALEGDTVLTKSPYLLPKETVPMGHVWVEGEHPEGTRHSNDSNLYGPIAKSLLAGQVKGIVLPWARAGRIRWQDYRGSPRVMEGSIENPTVM